MQKKTNKPEEQGHSAGHTVPSQASYGSGMTVGLNMLSSIVVGLLIGWGLDKLFDTKPIFLLVFMFLGMAAGFRTIWYYMNNQPVAKPSSKVGEADGDDPGEGHADDSSDQRDDT